MGSEDSGRVSLPQSLWMRGSSGVLIAARVRKETFPVFHGLSGGAAAHFPSDFHITAPILPAFLTSFPTDSHSSSHAPTERHSVLQ